MTSVPYDEVNRHWRFFVEGYQWKYKENWSNTKYKIRANLQENVDKENIIHTPREEMMHSTSITKARSSKFRDFVYYISIKLKLHTIDTVYTFWPTNPVALRKWKTPYKNGKLSKFCVTPRNEKYSSLIMPLLHVDFFLGFLALPKVLSYFVWSIPFALSVIARSYLVLLEATAWGRLHSLHDLEVLKPQASFHPTSIIVLYFPSRFHLWWVVPALAVD